MPPEGKTEMSVLRPVQLLSGRSYKRLPEYTICVPPGVPGWARKGASRSTCLQASRSTAIPASRSTGCPGLGSYWSSFRSGASNGRAARTCCLRLFRGSVLGGRDTEQVRNGELFRGSVLGGSESCHMKVVTVHAMSLTVPSTSLITKNPIQK